MDIYSFREEAEKAADFIPLAFDVEWPFSFKTGPGKAALIQLCYDINLCYLFQISEMSRLPRPLLILLGHPKVRCHGVNIKKYSIYFSYMIIDISAICS